MGKPAQPTELIEFLTRYPPEVQKLALDGRRFMQSLLPDANEIFYDANSAVCSGFTYTDKVSGNFTNLAVFSDHVTLIFTWGIALEDPEGRLKGGGNQIRHIRLASMETLQEPYVVGLIRQASDAAPRPAEPLAPTTIVKVMAGVKRRPKATR